MSVSVRVSVTVVGGQTGARRGHGTTGLRAHAGTPNGSPGPPILDRAPNGQSYHESKNPRQAPLFGEYEYYVGILIRLTRMKIKNDTGAWTPNSVF